jgi:hypothetical protein
VGSDAAATRGHAEDMPQTERLFMLGLLAGSLENALVVLGVLVRTKTGRVLGPWEIEKLAADIERDHPGT